MWQRQQSPASAPLVESGRCRGGFWLLVLGLWAATTTTIANCATDPQDVAALTALWSAWQGTPSLWSANISSDPCDTSWPGIICNAATATTRVSSAIRASPEPFLRR